MEKQQIIIPDKVPNLPLEKKQVYRKDYLRRLDFVEQNDFLGGARRRRRGLKLALWTWASAMVDHLIILATTCLFLIMATLILKSSLKSLGFAAIYLYVGVSVAYFVLFRIFLGATLGEYSCGLRLGEPMQRLQKSYSARIILRSLIIIFSGVITLPLLSVLFKKDMAGSICGISIYSLK
jgi:hypothetical protein